MQHAIYEPRTFILALSLFYIFVFTTRFLILDMFLTTAGVRMQFPQQKLYQFDFSIRIPVKILEIYSTVFLYPVFWVRRAVGHTESILF